MGFVCNVNGLSLLPCPFCGGLPEVNNFSDDDTPTNYMTHVICGMCGAGIFRHYSDPTTAQSLAITSWNNRFDTKIE